MEMQCRDKGFAGGEPNLGNRRTVVAASLLSVAMGAVCAAMASHAGSVDTLDGLMFGGHRVG